MQPGEKFRKALELNSPLIIPGTINAYSAKLAERANHKAIYLSGSGVAAASYGLPDLGITSMNDVLIDVKRITNATSLPLLVDIDTGWGDADNISKTIFEMNKAGCAAVHIEDQVFDKRKLQCLQKLMIHFLLWPEQTLLLQKELLELLKDVKHTLKKVLMVFF